MLEKDICNKIDAGFAESVDTDKKSDVMNSMRMEALKMSYQFLSPNIKGWNVLTRKEQFLALEAIFELADINMQYIKDGSVTLE